MSLDHVTLLKKVSLKIARCLLMVLSVFPSQAALTQSVVTNAASPAQSGTQPSNIGGVRYIQLNPATFRWSAAIKGREVTGAQTLSFTPCPPGVFGNDPNLYVMLNNNAEIDQAQTGVANPCIPGANGNIKFTIRGTYANPTVGSSSSGIYEGIVDAEANGTGVSRTTANNFAIRFQPTTPPQSTFYAIYAPVTIANGIADIDGSGASLDIETPSFGFYIPATGNTVDLVIHGFRIGTKTTMNGAPITNVVCSADTSTITSTLNPVLGSYVDIQWADNTHYWGVHGPVTTSSASSFTLTDNRCAWAAKSDGAGESIASAASLGNVAPAHAFALDNGSGVTFRDIYFASPGWASGKFLNNGIIVWNDQAFNAENVSVQGSGFNCAAAYCGQAFYAPGGSLGGGSMAAVGWLKSVNLSMQCRGNGINWLSGNSLNVTDSVIQGQSQFAVQGGNLRGNYAGIALTNTYGEASAACPNPFFAAAGLSGAAAASQAGIIALGNDISLGASPVGPSGILPNFSTGGATTYTYYVVIHDGSNITAPLPFGRATPSGGSFPVGWPRYASQSGKMVTYDILKVANNHGQRGVPLLNGANQPIGMANAVAQCSALVCTVTDTGAALSNYAPSNKLIGLDPYLWNWPGHIVLSHGGHLFTGGGLIGGIGGTVTTRPDYQTVFAAICNQDSPNVYVSCLATDNGGSGHPNGATMMPNSTNFGGGAPNLKGRLNFGTAYTTVPSVGHIITLWDSCPSCTLADPFHRPANNSTDGYIGIDSSGSLTNFGLAFGAATSISQYIGNAGDNSAYGERLTSSKKMFAVPVALGKPMTYAALNAQVPCNSANEGMTNPVTDSATALWGATITGGSKNHVLAYCDGTNWTVVAK